MCVQITTFDKTYPGMVTFFLNKQHLTVFMVVLTSICSNEEGKKLITQSSLTCRKGRDQLVNASVHLFTQKLYLNLTKYTYRT